MTNPLSKSTPLVPPPGWMEIGSIVGAQGIKGEVKVYPNSDFPERFEFRRVGTAHRMITSRIIALGNYHSNPTAADGAQAPNVDLG
jgi:ribosomal 30S subunit maturation factor RimM